MKTTMPPRSCCYCRCRPFVGICSTTAAPVQMQLINMRFWFIHLLLLPAAVLGYQIPRREAFRQAVGGAASAVLFAPTMPANAVLRSAGCYQGEGEACAELAGENALIKSLQEKSSVNRERNEKVSS